MVDAIILADDDVTPKIEQVSDAADNRRSLFGIRNVAVMQIKRQPTVDASRFLALIEYYAVPLTALTANDATDNRRITSCGYSHVEMNAAWR